MSSKNGSVKLFQLHKNQGSPLFPIFRSTSTVIPLVLNPSSLISVSLVPDLHLLPPSAPFWPYGTHPFFQHIQTILILSDILYSQTPLLFYAPLHSLLYPIIPYSLEAFGLKQEAHLRWTRDRSRVNWEEFVRFQVRANETYSEAKRQFGDRNRDVLMIVQSPNKWWSTLKCAVFGSSSALPPLVSEGGGLVCESIGKADLLSDHFDS